MTTPPGPIGAEIGDPYVVLGVPRDACRRAIAEAYRRLAKRHHPDVDSDPGAADRMRRINAAWQALSDPRTPGRRAAQATSSAHWSAGHRTARRAATRTSGSWAAWDSRTPHHDPRWRRAAGSWRVPDPHRAPPPGPADARFQDTGWAALLAVGVMLAVLCAAAYAGSLSVAAQTA
jgi:hypothetical protein